MGCGQSKINIYRRNKNGSKGHSAKKSGAADKEADEEEGGAGAGAADEPDEDRDDGKHVLPLAPHAASTTLEVSASQQDFFKMLDEKIDQGRDYDSSSESELRLEHDRRRMLIEQWRSASQSSQTSQAQWAGSPRHPAPPRRCPRSSPPPRRAHSAHAHHAPDPRHINGDSWHEPTHSPVKRPQSAGSNWKNTKVAPCNQKPKKNEANEHQKAKEENQDISHVTYNPTFQTHSPAHSAKSQPQPYIAQIMTYPVSQQVTPPSPPKYIAPPEEYQDPEHGTPPRPAPAPAAPPHVYYITGSPAADIAHQRQQTAIHLQQFVAMKQAQQQMYSYLQRAPHAVFPNLEYVTPNRMYEGEEYAYGHPALRPHSAPPPVGVVRPMPAPAGFPADAVPVPMWPHVAPVVASMGPWLPGQAPELQYYPQSQYVPMYRPHSAGSAGTLTRYKREPSEVEMKNSVCQSINVVRQKAVGQIVGAGGGELAVRAAADSPSPASVSTDSGVSPGASAPGSKTSVCSAAVDTEHKHKNKIFTTRSLKSSKSLES